MSTGNLTLINFKIPAELKARMLAVAEGRPLTALIREALVQWVREEEARARKT